MYSDFDGKSILVYDCETSSLLIETAKLQWFGAYSYLRQEYFLLPYKGNEKEIKNLIAQHKVLVGFNNKDFDNPIIQNNLNNNDIFEYKVILDLLEMSAPKGGKDYGKFRKNRLAQMGVKLKNFSLKNIIEILQLDKSIGTKGDIDYKIFQKDEWTPEEVSEIKKYLQQDIDLTMLLFQWYHEQYKPLMKFLPQKDQDNFLYLKSSLSVLAYNIICHKAGLEPVFGEKTGMDTKKFSGGYHIENKWDLIKGQIIEIDATSMYPHMIMMGNLCSPIEEDGVDRWDGDGYFKLDGKYNKKEQGKIELALKDIFLERLKAKKSGDKAKNLSYKIIINSFFGILGNNIFKSVYNRNSASDCTSMARTIIKKTCKTLEVNGFVPLGGFTDSIFIYIPPHLTKKQLMFLVNEYVKDIKSHVQYPMDTFGFEIEEEIKMIWFVAKNCYLFVTNKDEVKYKSTLLNTNTPKAVMKLFEEYMKPIIISQLDIPFTKKELEEKMRAILEKEPEIAAQEYKVGELNEYKTESSLPYQISKKYGSGRHFLIPNKQKIGVGLGKSTKKKIGIRHCSIEEFKNKNLTINDIDLTHLLSHLKPFYERNEKHETEKYKQLELF